MSKRMIAFMMGSVLLSGMLGAGLTAWLLLPRLATAQANVVTAQELRLVDGSGRLRGRLSVGTDGTVLLGMLDGGGQTRADLGVLANGTPVLRMRDAGGQAKMILDAGGQDGLPIMTFRDKRGATRLRFEVEDDDSPSIYQYDQEGRVRWIGALLADGTPLLDFRDTNRTSRLRMDLDEEGDPSLRLRDSTGPRLVLSVVQDGSAVLSAFDAVGKERTIIGVSNLNWPLLRMFDAEGNFRVRMGVLEEAEGAVPTLTFRDVQDRPRAALSLSPPDDYPTLTLWDEAGNPLFNAPDGVAPPLTRSELDDLRPRDGRLPGTVQRERAGKGNAAVIQRTQTDTNALVP